MNEMATTAKPYVHSQSTYPPIPYRLRAWNLIGHSDSSVAHVTTPEVPSLWTKPWRLISPWRTRTGANSATSEGGTATTNAGGASSSRTSRSSSSSAGGVGNEQASGFVESGAVEAEESWGWRDGVRAAWVVLSWAWWAVRAALRTVQTLMMVAVVTLNVAVSQGRGEGGARGGGGGSCVLYFLF